MIKSFVTKVSEIFDLGIKNSYKKINLAKKKLMFGIICGIIESRSVVFNEIALTINDEVEVDSNLRRIQLFFAEYQIDYLQVAIILMSFIPKRKLVLCLDRTNWQFGEVDINILTLTAKYQGVGVPIFFEMLDKRGNSLQTERIDLIEMFVHLFGIKRIKCVIGDREFIGEKWYNYLLNNKIDFYIRILKSHKIEINGVIKKSADLLTGKIKSSVKNVKVNGVKVNIGLKYLNTEDDDKYLIVITNKDPENACQNYQERWSIEVFFQSIKGRGFDIEATHLQDLQRLKKLMALVCIAFVWCLTIGIWNHENVKKISTKNHGYKSKSYFRNGLDKFRKVIKRIDKLFSQFEIIVDVLWEKITKINICYNLHIKNVM